MISNKKKKSQDPPLTSSKERLAQIIANGINNAQHIWATWMARQYTKLGKKAQLIFLSGYVLLMLLLSCYISINTLTSKSKIINSAIKPIQGVVKLDPEIPMARGAPDPAYLRIQQFRKMMDSMATTLNGRQMRDSLLRSRPMLMDSILKIEKLYHQLNKD